MNSGKNCAEAPFLSNQTLLTYLLLNLTIFTASIVYQSELIMFLSIFDSIKFHYILKGQEN